MKGNRSRDTQPEVAVRSAAHRLGLRFRKHERPVPDLRCTADLVFRSARLAVFVDGCFWHSCPDHGRPPRTNESYWAAKLRRNIERDRRNDEDLRARGWNVLRIWEHDDPHHSAERIAQLVRDHSCNELAPRFGE
jgi:DNA mismatch endonuclease (patch repair protein)